MAGLAFKPGFLSPVRLREVALAFNNVRNEKLVLFYQIEVVAFLADDVPVFSPLPFAKRLLHNVTGSTKIRIFLSMTIILVTNHNTENRYDDD